MKNEKDSGVLLLTDEFLIELKNSKKINFKKKLLDDLIESLKSTSNITTLIKDEKVQKRFENLFNDSKSLLNENNNNFIITEINLISYLSTIFINDQSFSKFILEILPKLFDKFNLQNQKINKSLLTLFNTFIDKKIIQFYDFFPYIENVSIDDEDNFKINILEFLQCQIDNEQNIKTIPNTIIELLKKLKDDKNNEEIGHKALSILEMITTRNISPDIKKEEEKKVNKEEFKNDITDKREIISNEELTDNKNDEVEQMEINNINDNNNNLVDNTSSSGCKSKFLVNKGGKNKRNFKNLKGKFGKNSDKIVNKFSGNINSKIENNIEEPNNKNEEETIDDKQTLSNHAQENKGTLCSTTNDNKIPFDDIPIGLHNKNENLNDKEYQDELNKLKENQVIAVSEVINNIDSKNSEDRKENINETNKVYVNEYDEKPLPNNKNINENKVNCLIQQQEEENYDDENNDLDLLDINDELPNESKKIYPINEEQLLSGNYDNNQLFEQNFFNDIPYNEIENDENQKNKYIFEHQSEPTIKEINNINEDVVNISPKKENEIDENELLNGNEFNDINLQESDLKENEIEIPTVDFTKNLELALQKEKENEKIKNKNKNININSNENTPIKAKNEAQNDNITGSNAENNTKEATPSENSNTKKSKKIEDDQQFDEIKLQLGSECVKNLNSNKWEDKKIGFESINNYILNNKKTLSENIQLVDDLISYIKIKLKNFKETNFNLVKEALNIFNSLLQNKLISKENSLLILDAYYEKVIDNQKIKDIMTQLILNLLEIISPETFINNITEKIIKKNNAKLLIEYSIIYGKIIEDNKAQDIPLGEIINFCVNLANNNNSKVRTSATNLLCILYKFKGENVKKLIQGKGIKESTLKVIESELEKIVPIVQPKGENKKKIDTHQKIDENATQKFANNNNIDYESLPRVDISKKLTNDLLKNLKDGKWADKKEAIDTIDSILKSANMKISNNGLAEFFDILKNKLSDSNKRLVKICINLLGKFIISLGTLFKPFAKCFALALIPNLGDKMQMVRDEAMDCIEKWTENVGIDTIIVHMPYYLKNDNFDIRNEIFKYLIKFKEEINKNKNICENFFKEMAEPLIICIQDKNSVIRNYAEEIITFSSNFININYYYKYVQELKPIIANDIKHILNKIKEQNEDIVINNMINLHLDNDENENNKEKKLNNDDNSKEKIETKEDKNKENKETKESKEIKESKETKETKDKKMTPVSAPLNSDIQKENKNDNECSDKANQNTNSNPHHNIHNSLEHKNEKEKISRIKSMNGKKANLNDALNNSLDNISNNNSETTNETHKSKNAVINNNINQNKEKVKEKEKDKDKENNVLKPKNDKKNNLLCLSDIKKSQRVNKVANNSCNKIKRTHIKELSNEDINKLVDVNNSNIINNVNNPVGQNKKMPERKKTKGMQTKSSNLKKFIIKNENPVKSSDSNSNSNENTINMVNNANTNTTKEISQSLIYLNNPNVKPSKDKRNELDKKSRFTIDQLPYEFLNNKVLIDQIKNLFTDFFVKKILNDQCNNVIDAVNLLKISIDKNENINFFIDHLDIILKVIAYKFINNQNPKMLKILFDFLDSLLTLLNSIKYTLNDIEIRIILPLLVDKISINDNELKESLFFLINRYVDAIGASKAILLMLDCSFTKNYKIQGEILDLCVDLYLNGIIDITPKPFIAIFCMFINVNDLNIKEKVINLFKEIYRLKGEDMWNYVELNDKDREFLYESIHNDDSEDDEENEDEDGELEVSDDDENEEICQEYNEDETYKNEVLKYVQNMKKNKERKDVVENLNKPKPDGDKNNVNSVNNNENKNATHKITVQCNKNINTSSHRNRNRNKNNNINCNNVKSQENSGSMNSSPNKKSNIKVNKNTVNITNFANNNISNKNISNNARNEDLIETNNLCSVKTKKDLCDIFDRLLQKDQVERINTIIIINELICPKYEENKFLLIENIDYIISTIISSMQTVFKNKNITNGSEDIPIKFAKYLATILCKICSNKELICNLSYEILFNLSEELLNNLLIENLDKIGNNQEGSIIFKSFNSTMLRVIDNCNSTYVIISLFDIIKKYRNLVSCTKITVLAIKCLFRINQNLEKIINILEIDKILSCIRMLLINYELTNPNYEPKNQTDQIIIKCIKSFINEIVEFKGEIIINTYYSIINKDNDICLKSCITDKMMIAWIKNFENKCSISTNNTENNTIVNSTTNNNSEDLKQKNNESNENTNNHAVHAMSNVDNYSNNISNIIKNRITSNISNNNCNNKANKNNIKGSSSINHPKTSKKMSVDYNLKIADLKKKMNMMNKKGKNKK